MRHAARAHPGPRQAGGRPGPARAAAAARGPAADGARLGDPAAARARRLRCPRGRAGSPRPRGGGGAHRRSLRPDPAHAAPGGRGGDPGRARGRPPPGRSGADQPGTAGGAVERPAGRGRRARDLRRDRSPTTSPRRPRRRSSSRSSGPPTAAGRPRSLAWWGAFDLAVDLFSGRPGRTTVGRLHPAQLRATPRPSPSGGGRGTPAIRPPRSTPTPIPRPRTSRGPTCPRPAGTTRLGEYLLEWDDVRAAPDPRAVALEFARSVFRHACAVCAWDEALADSAEGRPPPVS